MDDSLESSPGLQFETVEKTGLATDGAGGNSCGLCSAKLSTEYHELNGQAVCASCRRNAESDYAGDTRWKQ